MHKVCVVLPTINEAANLVALIPALHYFLSNIEHTLVVVDDASTDGTPKVASELGAYVIERPARLGLGSAIHDGIMNCIKLNTCISVVMDADLQHPPSVVPELVNACSSNDVCIGVRTNRYALPAYRRLISRVAEYIGELVYGDGIPDLMSGFFAINLETMRDYILDFKPTPRNYKYLLEFLLYLKRLGAKPRVATIPYTQLTRVNGTSKMGIREIITFLKVMTREALSLD